jgi:predicted nuclease of predicted toxin-antitoxin system
MHDAIHAADRGMARSPDTEIMALAKTEDRIVVTADLDYPRLLALSQTDRPAVILFRNGDWSESETTRRLGDVLRLIPEHELTSSLVVVEKTRVRRRKLPL